MFVLLLCLDFILFFLKIVKLYNYCKSIERSDEVVVVVGGGFAGAYLASRLQDYFHVILIDTKDYFEFTPSILRTLVSPNHIKMIQIRHSDYLSFTKSHLVLDKVTSISKTSVTTSSNVEYNYDYLILCSGSTYQMPIKTNNDQNVVITNRGSTLISCYKSLTKAETISVIGGGIVGTELCAELVERFPKKQVHLIQSGKELMNKSTIVTQKARSYAQDWLTAHNAKLHLKQTVVELSKQNSKFILKSKKSNKITETNSEIIFLCTGIIPNSKFENSESINGDTVNCRGFLNVNDYLQLKGFQNIFVAGDLANLPEEKLAQNAENHASIVLHNLLKFHKGQFSEFKKYQVKPRPILISLGKLDGILVYKNWTFTGFIPAIFKEFVEWKVMTHYKNL